MTNLKPWTLTENLRDSSFYIGRLHKSRHNLSRTAKSQMIICRTLAGLPGRE